MLPSLYLEGTIFLQNSTTVLVDRGETGRPLLVTILPPAKYLIPKFPLLVTRGILTLMTALQRFVNITTPYFLPVCCFMKTNWLLGGKAAVRLLRYTITVSSDLIHADIWGALNPCFVLVVGRIVIWVPRVWSVQYSHLKIG